MLIRPAYRLIYAATLTASLTACRPDVTVGESASAGDPSDNLTDSGADAPEDDPDFDPLDYCTPESWANPEGTIHRCEGDFSSTITFDYYGDPDLGIENLLVCVDVSATKVVDPGYVFTCFMQRTDHPFGTEGVDVDACCLTDAPEEAILPLCRIDASEEICEATSDKLNEFRQQIPGLPKYSEIAKQLLNLNLHIANGTTQSDCASTFAAGFVDVGDIDSYMDTVDWTPGDNSDPDTGWRWIRNIDMNVNSFHIDDMIDTESACGVQEFNSILDGALAPLRLTFDGPLGQGKSSASSGRFSLAVDECATGACRAELRSLELDVPNFEVGPIQLSGLSIRLVQPALGHMNGAQLRIPGHELALVVEGSARALSEVSLGGLDLGEYLDGGHQRLTMRASEDFVAELDAEELAITDLQIDTWPVTARATTESR